MSEQPSRVRRGRLRIYLGAAPGVGKTFAMLDEGNRRLERGADVVVGFVETHGRAATEAAIAGLEVLPRAVHAHRGIDLGELDVDALIARDPDIALIDELAHTNAPGGRHPKRWEDVEEVLAAGIDVITTLNVQHLESLNDVVRDITGVVQRETIPDHVARAADQIELVDMSPQALRRRLAHGNVYPPDRIDAALAQFFREGNLTALREIALLWLADRVDAALEQYRQANEISQPWRARERVVVALSGDPEGDALVRRAIRIVERASGGQLYAVHVTHADGLTSGSEHDLARQRRLVEDADGTFHVVAGERVSEAVLDFARGVNASQIVVGESTRSRVRAAFSLTDTRGIIRGSEDIDVLVVSHHGVETGRLRRRREGRLSGRRVAAGWTMAAVGVPALAGLLVWSGSSDELSFALMAFLSLTVGVAAVGGLGPALLAAALSAVCTNFFFSEPRLTLHIARPEDAIAIALLFLVAVGVSRLVSGAATRAREATAARAEADLVTSASLDVIAGGDAIPALLARLREGFGLAGLRIVTADGATIGTDPAAPAGEPAAVLPLEDGARVLLWGEPLPPRSMRVVLAVCAQAAALAERRDAAVDRARARTDRERGEVRRAILAAVSHDLRTPLAGIVAAASALSSPSLDVDEADARALLADIRISADRLQHLVDDLLDMTRIDTGAVTATAQPTWIMDTLVAACAGVDPDAVELDVADDVGQVEIDGGLLERVIANLVENAVRHSPADVPVRVSTRRSATELVIAIVDRGAGVPEADRDRMFESFQRLGDAPGGAGLGLGLAVARGLATAIGADLRADDTPGGGLTMVVTVPLGDEPPAVGSAP
ncbi:sensor histidine kinase [Demequina silvatica]|uniref:sensor histidine kinase n=1 Tax=Demequina silvatica TaxID=1638988 RepID=UPI000780D216|nr:ATP-binding protein [Demequina silvatica]